ncbi:hypothetical protein D6827_03425 [Candidatus Parcubacteria bacterium]|nr:MAG: hypothetical protein D6827_03425 [Candidatus Parcubacteria bacterium]
MIQRPYYLNNVRPTEVRNILEYLYQWRDVLERDKRRKTGADKLLLLTQIEMVESFIIWISCNVINDKLLTQQARAIFFAHKRSEK